MQQNYNAAFVELADKAKTWNQKNFEKHNVAVSHKWIYGVDTALVSIDVVLLTVVTFGGDFIFAAGAEAVVEAATAGTGAEATIAEALVAEVAVADTVEVEAALEVEADNIAGLIDG